MHEYIRFPFLVDAEFVFSMLPKDEFIRYHQEDNDDACLEMDEHFRLNDQDAKALIFKISKCKNVNEFQLLEKKKRNECIHKLHQKGLSIRQISRLTGLSKKIVELNI